MEKLIKYLTKIDDENLMNRFLTDLLEPVERQRLEMRIGIATDLRKGYPYEDIESHTNASTATISKVKKALVYGADGYSDVLRRYGDEVEYGTITD